MNFNWADDTNCAVTVCDTEGVVIYQNKQSISVNGSIAAKACSPATTSARRIIARILEKATRMPTPSRKKDPQNDLPNSLAPRGRHRRRYHRTVDADSRRNAALRTGIIERPGPDIRTTQRHQELQPGKPQKKYTKQPLSIQEKSNDRLSSKTLRRGGSKRFTALSTAVFRKQERPRLIAGAPVYLLTTEISRIREDTWSVRTRRSYNQRSHAGRTDLSA